MVDRGLTFQHAPFARHDVPNHFRALPRTRRGRSRGARDDLYACDHIETRHAGRFRWLLSTCLAAAIGATAILVAIFGASDSKDATQGFLPALKRIRDGGPPPSMASILRRAEGLSWSVPKTDKLEATTGAFFTRYTIHDTLKQRRGSREYMYAKPYVRILARLAPAPSDHDDVIPPFNPFKLYANKTPVGSSDEEETGEQVKEVTVRVVELLGGRMPEEDGQELKTREVEEIVRQTLRTTQQDDDVDDELLAGRLPTDSDLVFPNTTIIEKTDPDSDLLAEGDLEGREVKVIKVAAGDTLTGLLRAAGADVWQAQAMREAAKDVIADDQLEKGQELRITLVPSFVDQNRLEPSRFSIHGAQDEHLITVSRSAAGEFVSDTELADVDQFFRAAIKNSERERSSSLYASVYYAALTQNIEPEQILQIMRIHAYETDFRRRLRAGDQVELFFDPKQKSGVEGPPGELLYSSITSGGEVSRFFRFRTSDGVVDFYDESGSNSRKFLMRRPVRGDDVRLTSGYGMRFHPLLNRRRMHTGVDWASPSGTPILAAGNGTIEEAGRKGQYGNYVRVRHANGYQTAYGHLSRIAPGVAPGVKVRQGQVIGRVGSTGLSSGPHLHFEVLVNNRFVNPMSIQVPRERHLEGAELAAFQRERTRIEKLMRRPPDVTKTASR